MECGEKLEQEAPPRGKNYRACPSRDRVEGGGRVCSHHPEDVRGDPGRGEGHPSRTYDTLDTVSPSLEKGEKLEATISGNI